MTSNGTVTTDSERSGHITRNGGPHLGGQVAERIRREDGRRELFICCFFLLAVSLAVATQQVRAAPRVCGSVKLYVLSDDDSKNHLEGVPGQRVRLTATQTGSSTETTTSDEGRFCFEEVPRGVVQLHAWGDIDSIGSTGDVEMCVNDSTPPRVQLVIYPPLPCCYDCAFSDPPPIRFRLETGMVQDPFGHPIRGASLVLADYATEKEECATRSNRHGRYHFPTLPLGRYKLIIRARGFLPRVIPFVEAACAGGPKRIDVEMFPECKVR